MLAIEHLEVRLGGQTIVQNVSLKVATGEIVALLGPSGAGKSTLLRAVAGLVNPVQGTVSWNGRPLNGVPPHERGFGFMFQDYALFPHRNVGGNVGFGLEMRGMQPDEIAATVHRTLDWVGLAGTESRSVDSLSGGEQQRVALARALAPGPNLMMLDEPVGSLDRELRTRLIGELATLLRQRDMTTIVVTHDQAEAFSIADRVAVMRDGHLVAVDTPQGLWTKPPDEWTARFLGMTNVVDHPEKGRILIRPEAISLGGDDVSGVAKSVVFGEGTYRATVETSDGWELSFSSSKAVEKGQVVGLTIDSTGIVEL